MGQWTPYLVLGGYHIRPGQETEVTASKNNHCTSISLALVREWFDRDWGRTYLDAGSPHSRA